ncbi:MAG TPA: putative zinc-binding peptidase, partial [Arenibaculum sp.]|nr:putative zinc-binding peptidase [Arenibaculum sp.]
MRLFTCQNCQQLLYFENTRCERCGLTLGYLPDVGTLSALEPDGELWRTLAVPGRTYRYCANAVHGACNWLVPHDGPTPFCVACRHNRTIPDLSVPENLRRWRKLEIAKRRLVYTLLKLHLPLKSKSEDAATGLAFDFLADPDTTDGGGPAVMTGHDNGLITINLAEADDVERERRRDDLGEPYRTVLGHLRHEVGHYYWDRLVRDAGRTRSFRALFGDESRDYGEALKAHYANGPAADWRDTFVSSYASSHPWEDFAETWAHYLHIIDTLETAKAFRVKVDPEVVKGDELTSEIDFDVYGQPDFTMIIE